MSKCTCIEQDGHEQNCPSRPLQPGDYVLWENIRWDTFRWIEGVLVSLEPNPAYPRSHHARIDIKRSYGFAEGTTQTVGVGRGVTLRRCERVGDSSYITVTGTTSYTFPKSYAAGLGVAEGRIVVQSDPAFPSATLRDAAPEPSPVLYDGITAEQCLELYVESQRYESEPARKLLTPARLAAARELWSAQLRAKCEAAKEKERCAVTYCEVDADE